jgi:hypothetical protein
VSEWIAFSHEAPTEDDLPMAVALISNGEIEAVDATVIISDWAKSCMTHWARLPGVPRPA